MCVWGHVTVNFMQNWSISSKFTLAHSLVCGYINLSNLEHRHFAFIVQNMEAFSGHCYNHVAQLCLTRLLRHTGKQCGSHISSQHPYKANLWCSSPLPHRSGWILGEKAGDFALLCSLGLHTPLLALWGGSRPLQLRIWRLFLSCRGFVKLTCNMSLLLILYAVGLAEIEVHLIRNLLLLCSSKDMHQ